MKFKEWVASYSGCDGGSPDKSSIWFVGIEWGFAKKPGQSDAEHEQAVREYHRGGMHTAIKQGYSEPHSDKFSLNDNIDYTFGINSTKLMAAINGYSVYDYQLYAENCPDTEVFKLNLYPVGLPNVQDSQWDKYELQEITGMSSKQQYRELCEEHRFPFFRSEVDRYNPKIILCVGLSYLSQFAKCFCNIHDISELNREEIADTESETNNKPRSLYWKKLSNGTLFVVVPFVMYPSGLNSHNLQQLFGDRISELAKPSS